MRRKDREMDREFAEDLIDRSSFGTLALLDEEGLYSLPLSFVREGNYLYFHSAREGRKVKILDREPELSVSFVGENKVPNLYKKNELDSLVKEGRIGEIISKVYTTEYESAIVYGSVEKLVDNKLKEKALELICKKYTPDRMDYFKKAIEKSLDLVNIYRLEINKISGKRKSFDENREEKKWMRMD